MTAALLSELPRENARYLVVSNCQLVSVSYSQSSRPPSWKFCAVFWGVYSRFSCHPQPVNTLTHDCQPSRRSHVSVNAAFWNPVVGSGIVYGTNRGHLKMREVDLVRWRTGFQAFLSRSRSQAQILSLLGRLSQNYSVPVNYVLFHLQRPKKH